MVNIEVVHTRWVNDINAFLQAADDQVQTKFNVAIADWMLDTEREKDESKGGRWKPKGPAEGGWVVEIRGWTDHDGGDRFINRSLLRNLQRTDTFAQQTDKDSGKEGGKVGKYIVGVQQDPVKGRISHAFVYRVFAPIHDPQPGVFYNITRGSFLDTLIDGGGSGFGFPGGPGGFGEKPGGPMPTGAPTPIGGPPGGPPGGASAPAAAAPAASLAPKWTGLGGTGGPATATQNQPPKKDDSTRRRYEFVVMLVWREPGATNPQPAQPAP
jgi:hypothetical protein